MSTPGIGPETVGVSGLELFSAAQPVAATMAIRHRHRDPGLFMIELSASWVAHSCRVTPHSGLSNRRARSFSKTVARTQPGRENLAYYKKSRAGRRAIV